MEIKSMYKKPLQGNKPVEVKIDLTYKDGKSESVVYTPAMIPERYGTNPHQLFTLLVPKDYNFRLREAKSGKAFSLTNIEDSFWATELLKYMDEPCCVVMKHLNPCGAASSDDMVKSFLRAWYCDFRAAFGGVVGFNKPVTKELAQLMVEMVEDEDKKKSAKYFIEVVAAPDYEEGALNELEKRKDLRALIYDGLDRIPKYLGDMAAPVIKTIGGMDGMLAFEDRFLTRIKSPEDFLLKEYTRPDGETIKGLGVVTEKSPTQEELQNLKLGWHATSILRSNSTAIVKDGCLISPGTGQQARIASVVESIRKVDDLNRLAEEDKNISTERRKIFDYSLEGSVLASEALFPYPDSVEAIGPRGITAIAQTGGSIKDAEVVEAANKYNLSMVFTGERCFSHH